MNSRDIEEQVVIKVSVCITTYNHATFIEQCIKSVLNQKTNFDFEICLGEDGSDDGTREICKDLAERYPDIIRLFLRDRKDVHYIDGKPTGRYNFYHTLKACKGKYIAIIDGDDYWCDELKLHKTVNILDSMSNISLVFHDAAIVDEFGVKSGRTIMPKHFPQIGGVKQLLETNIATGSSVVMRYFDVSSLGEWFWQTTMGDWPLNLYVLQFGDMYAIEEVMSCYRQHPNSVWSSKTESEFHYAMAKSYKIILRAGLFNGYNQEALNYYLVLLENLKSNNPIIRQEKKLVNKIIKQKPYYISCAKMILIKLFFGGLSKDNSWLGHMRHLKGLK